MPEAAVTTQVIFSIHTEQTKKHAAYKQGNQDAEAKVCSIK